MYLQPKKAKFFIALLSFVFIMSLIGNVLPVQAAEFYPKNKDEQNVVIKATRENVYAYGTDVKVDDSVARDLVLAGSTINIRGNVGRSIIAAGSEITINSNRVGGATRLAASKITLSGNFGEEVIVAANEVIIENANINGDLIVAASKLTIKNSKISGDAKLSYSEVSGDVDQQVQGEVIVSKADKQDNGTFSSENIYSFLTTQFSVIVFLLIVGSILSRRNALHLSDVEFNSSYWKHLGLGFGVAILTLPIVIILSVMQLYALALTLGATIYLLFFLSSFFFPIYAASLAKNTFKLDYEIKNVVIVTYLIIAVLSFMPVVNVISYIIFFFVQCANFGYLTAKLNQTIFNSLPTVSNTVKKEKVTKIDMNEELEAEMEDEEMKKSTKSKK